MIFDFTFYAHDSIFTELEADNTLVLITVTLSTVLTNCLSVSMLHESESFVIYKTHIHTHIELLHTTHKQQVKKIQCYVLKL